MPFAGGNQHQAAGPDGQAPGVVLHLTGALLDEVEVLRRHRARFRRLVHVARRMRVGRVLHAADCRSHAPESPVSLLTQKVRSRNPFSSTSDRRCASSKT